MLTKTQIKDLSKEYNFYLKKSLGQTFLIDKNSRDKIIRLIELERDDVVLEIGSGLGALTEALAEKCGWVYALEKDKRICELSEKVLSGYKNLNIINADFLKFDLNSLLFRNIKVVGALPYYITTPIIEHLLDFRKRIRSAFITVQKEVASRLSAERGDDGYCSLSLFVQYYSDVSLLMDMKRDSFFPRPEVDSTLVRLDILPHPRIEPKDEETLFKVIRTAFNQRRKTLLSVLSQKRRLSLVREDVLRILNNIGIDSKIRPEALALEEFVKIADAVFEEKAKKGA